MTSTSTMPPSRPGEAPGGWMPPHGPWRYRPHPGLLGGVVLGGFAFDLAVQHPIGLATVAAFVLLACGSILGGWIDSGPPRLALLAAAVPATMLMVRASVWLIPLNLIAAAALVALAAIIRDEPHPVSRALGRMVRPVPVIQPLVVVGELLSRAFPVELSRRYGGRGRITQVIRGLMIAVPIAYLLIRLLAASDALFRSLVHISFDAAFLAEHTALVAIGIAGMAALAAHGSWREVTPPRQPRGVLGAAEVGVTLAAIVAVYSLFVATQVVAITAGADYVERTTGLTYAEYARQGFFQLLAAAFLTLVVLLTLDRHRATLAPRARRRILLLEETVVVLTLLVVAVALRRLFLYEGEFGLTMLRLSTMVFAAWIGVVFVIVGLHLAGRLRADPSAAILVSAFVVLMAVNLADPEAVVAQRNIDRFEGTEQLDTAYLVNNLGPDAMPTIATDDRARELMCRRATRPDDRLAVFNLGRARGAATFDKWCT